MPYLDGSPAPGDDKLTEHDNNSPEGAFKVAIDEPERMIADLLKQIYRINGRQITSFNVTWMDWTTSESQFVDLRPQTVHIESTTSVMNPKD